MKLYASLVGVSLTAVVLVVSCSNDIQLTGPSSLPTSSPSPSSHLAVVLESSEAKSCGGAEEAAMRFSSPGFVAGTTVGMYVNFAGLPDGAKKLRIWWDSENQPAIHQDISLADDDPIKEVIQHTYNGARAGDKRKVRVELIIEGHTNECIRVRMVELNDTTGPVVSAPPTARKIVFVTSATATANYNGLTQADTVCQNLATAAGLSGTFRAWLSNATDSPSTRFTQSTVPYKLVDGTQIADNWTDLTDGTIDNPINKTETNGGPPNTSVYSGTTANGTVVADEHCSNWTGAPKASVGNTGETGSGWTLSSKGKSCSFHYPIYCFEQ